MQTNALLTWVAVIAIANALADEGLKEDCLPEFGECDGDTDKSQMRKAQQDCSEDEELGVCHLQTDKKKDKPKVDCPKGFDWLDGTCIHISLLFYSDTKHFNALNWYEAQNKCRSIKAEGWKTDLYSITSTSRLELINKRLRDKFPDLVETEYTFWTGAAKTSGEWRWPNGELVDPMSYIWLLNQTPKDLDEPRLLLVPADKTHRRLYAFAAEADTKAPSFLCEAIPSVASSNATVTVPSNTQE